MLFPAAAATLEIVENIPAPTVAPTPRPISPRSPICGSSLEFLYLLLFVELMKSPCSFYFLIFFFLFQI